MQRRLHEHCSVVQRWPWYPPNSIIESSWRWPLNFTFSLLFCNPLTSLFQCVTSALSVDFYDRKTTLHKQCTLNSTFQKLVRRCVNQTSHLPLAASMSLAQPHTEKYELQRRRRQELWFRLRINYAAPWLTTDQDVPKVVLPLGCHICTLPPSLTLRRCDFFSWIDRLLDFNQGSMQDFL